MSDILESYVAPKQMRVKESFILSCVQLYDANCSDNDFREVEAGETLIALAKVASSKCDSGEGYIIWDPVLKESSLVEAMLLEA